MELRNLFSMFGVFRNDFFFFDSIFQTVTQKFAIRCVNNFGDNFGT